MHFWKAGRIGSLTVEGDCILGHEAAGVVLKLGDGVGGLQIGMPMGTTNRTTKFDAFFLSQG